MARPLRLEFPGAVYHITARGNARELIFTDDRDLRCFVDFFAGEIEQQGWRCYAWCFMGNHYLCGASHNTTTYCSKRRSPTWCAVCDA